MEIKPECANVIHLSQKSQNSSLMTSQYKKNHMQRKCSTLPQGTAISRIAAVLHMLKGINEVIASNICPNMLRWNKAHEAVIKTQQGEFPWWRSKTALSSLTAWQMKIILFCTWLKKGMNVTIVVGEISMYHGIDLIAHWSHWALDQALSQGLLL